MSGVRKGAIVGFGNVAANGHLPGWRARSDFHIVAVVEPDPERRTIARQALPEARLYGSVADLLQTEPLDFVDIATPPAWHASAIGVAAQHGVHVLCEKPLTTKLDDYRAVASAVRERGVVLHTVHNWKYAEAFQRVQRSLADGYIGRLRSMTFETERNGCAVATGENWRIRPSIAGGGILVDHGWHVFYLMAALAGERPVRVGAHLEQRRFTDVELEDTAHCVVEFPSCRAEVKLTWAAPARRTRWELVGTKGRLVVDDDRLILESDSARSEERLATALSAGSHHPDWFAGVIESFRGELNDPAARGTNLAEAELCLLLLTLAYASSAEGARPLDVPVDPLWSSEGSPSDRRAHSAPHGG